MTNRISVLIVDDQSLFREALRTLLSANDDIKIIGEAENGEAAIRLANNLKPSVILMDLRMPVMDGVTATKRITKQTPECKVIILTTFDDDEYVFDGLRAGAVGYLLKDVKSEKLFEAIFAAHRGEYFLLPSITAKVVSEFSRLSPSRSYVVDSLIDPLSPREIEILKLLATGITNKEISNQLVITEGTVKNHVSNILRKMNVQDRLQAVLKAQKIGLI